jgi:hypothetical protein
VVLEIGGDRLAGVVAHDCYAAAGLARCTDEFRSPIGGLGYCHRLDFQQGQLPLGTLADIPAAGSYGAKDLQRVGGRKDLVRYRDAKSRKTAAKFLRNRVGGHAREDAAYRAVEVE